MVAQYNLEKKLELNLTNKTSYILIDISVITAIVYTEYSATFDNLDIILTVRDGIISLGKLNSKHVRHSFTMSLFEFISSEYN